MRGKIINDVLKTTPRDALAALLQHSALHTASRSRRVPDSRAVGVYKSTAHQRAACIQLVPSAGQCLKPPPTACRVRAVTHGLLPAAGILGRVQWPPLDMGG